MAAPGLVDGIVRQMHHLADRQRVIAQNVANSETPGYKAREVSAPSFADLLATQDGGGGGAAQVARPRVSITTGMAALGATQTATANDVTLDGDVTETKPDGNNVTLEDQLLKLGRVQADFAAMTGLYRKQQALLKTALGKGSG